MSEGGDCRTAPATRGLLNINIKLPIFPVIPHWTNAGLSPWAVIGFLKIPYHDFFFFHNKFAFGE